jgi:FixJ family two-component response regulator
MTSATPIVHVVDDDESFRTAIARLLRAGGYQVALYSSGDQMLQVPPGTEPGCILLDIRMPGIDGLELQTRLTKQDCVLPIVFLTGHGDIPMTVRAIKAGAEDFLSKPITKETLFDAVERAISRYSQTRQQHDRLSTLRVRVAALTPRESEVFALVVRGKLNKQIAFELGTSERTIKAHRHSIMQKLQVASVAEAVSIAERLGMVAGSASVDRQ